MNMLTYIFKGGSGTTMDPAAIVVARWLMDHRNSIHNREAIERGCGIPMGGRSVDTHISNIRRALGPLSMHIICKHGVGYGWSGDPEELIPVQACHKKPSASAGEFAAYAVMTQDDVAKALGMSKQQVRVIERRALIKLRSNPEIKRLFKQCMDERQRMHYDPFHEIWLYAVGENLAMYKDASLRSIRKASA
jgi:DNA-binding XRE family transcriptional regulator